MRYFIFDTEQQAIDTIAEIDSKIRQRISELSPGAIDSGGVIPRNAKTGQLDPDKPRTSTWAIATQREDGKWIVPEITEDYNPIFEGLVFDLGYTVEDVELE
jgi:hypothetical protein